MPSTPSPEIGFIHSGKLRAICEKNASQNPVCRSRSTKSSQSINQSTDRPINQSTYDWSIQIQRTRSINQPSAHTLQNRSALHRDLFRLHFDRDRRLQQRIHRFRDRFNAGGDADLRGLSRSRGRRGNDDGQRAGWFWTGDVARGRRGRAFGFFGLFGLLDATRGRSGEFLIGGEAFEGLDVAEGVGRRDADDAADGAAGRDTFAHVLLQRAGDAEGGTAETAPVNVLARPAVSLHVPREFAALRAGVVAKVALVGFFSWKTNEKKNITLNGATREKNSARAVHVGKSVKKIKTLNQSTDQWRKFIQKRNDDLFESL